jgi:hypothetical protein
LFWRLTGNRFARRPSLVRHQQLCHKPDLAPSPLGSGFVSPIREEVMNTDSAAMMSVAAVDRPCLGVQTMVTRPSPIPLIPGTVQPSEQKPEMSHRDLYLPDSPQSVQRGYPRSDNCMPQIHPYQYASSSMLQQKQEAVPIDDLMSFAHPQLLSPEAAFYLFNPAHHHSDPDWWTRIISPEQGEMILAPSLDRQPRPPSLTELRSSMDVYRT